MSKPDEEYAYAFFDLIREAQKRGVSREGFAILAKAFWDALDAADVQNGVEK